MALDGLVWPAMAALALALSLGGDPRGVGGPRRVVAWLAALTLAGWLLWAAPATLTGTGPRLAADHLWFGAPVLAVGAGLGARAPAGVRWIARGVFAAGFAWLAFRAPRTHTWGAVESAAVVVGGAGAVAALWTAGRRGLDGARMPHGLAAMATWTGGVAVALAATGSLTYGMRMWPLSAALGALAVLARFGGGRPFAGVLAGLVTPLTLGMLALGVVFSATPAWLAGVLALAPLAARLLPRGTSTRRAPAVP